MAIKTISQFDVATPTSNDKILFEQNGEGKNCSIGDAVNTCSLTLEEIQATTDLSGKIASASALKLLSAFFDYNVSPTSSLDVSNSGFKLYTAAPNTVGTPTSNDYYLVLSFTPVNDNNFGIQIACAYDSHTVYLRRKWADWIEWKQLSN